MLDEYMSNIGYTEEEKEMLKKTYRMTSYKNSDILYNFKNLVNYFHKSGFNNKDIKKITLIFPKITYTSTDTIKQKIKELNEFGINKIDTFNIIKDYPYILLQLI